MNWLKLMWYKHFVKPECTAPNCHNPAYVEANGFNLCAKHLYQLFNQKNDFSDRGCGGGGCKHRCGGDGSCHKD